jgi:hypothetical protein
MLFTHHIWPGALGRYGVSLLTPRGLVNSKSANHDISQAILTTNLKYNGGFLPFVFEGHNQHKVSTVAVRPNNHDRLKRSIIWKTFTMCSDTQCSLHGWSLDHSYPFRGFECQVLLSVINRGIDLDVIVCIKEYTFLCRDLVTRSNQTPSLSFQKTFAHTVTCLAHQHGNNAS